MIVIIGNYRTGSTTFLKEMIQLTGGSAASEYSGEYLHPCKYECFGLADQIEGKGYSPPDPKISLYKIMPDQVKDWNLNIFCKDFLFGSTVIYVARKNVQEQIKSQCECLISEVWHPQDSYGRSYENIKQYVDDDILDIAIETITRNIIRQHHFYKMWPGHVVFLEDRYNHAIKYPFRESDYTKEQIEKIEAAASQFDIEKMYE